MKSKDLNIDNWRTNSVLSLLIGALLIMGGRLVWLQIIKGDDFVSMAIHLAAKSGDISGMKVVNEKGCDLDLMR